MNAIAAILFLLAPVAAEPPAQPAYFVNVDIVVINRVRTYSVEYDPWGRPRCIASETVWISFWDRLLPQGAFPVPLLIDRGWWVGTQLRRMCRCSEGWVVESKGNINVIVREIWYIDSPFDWEMRNRLIFRPIRKP